LGTPSLIFEKFSHIIFPNRFRSSNSKLVS